MKHNTFLVKPASSLCDLRCRYCFYDDVSSSRACKNMGLLSHEMARELIEKAFAALPLHSVTVQVVENRGRDVGAFLCDLAPQLRGYDYACFMHDKKAIQTKPGSVGASFG